MNETDTVNATTTLEYESSSTSEELLKYALWEKTLIGIFLTTVIILSVVGNVLVCVAILTEKKLKKASNLFLISLAISDLVVSTLVMPFAVGNDILQYWPFARNFCDVWMAFDILSATASILNLCAISIDRYIHMRNPFAYERWMSNKKCLSFIAIIWVASILVSFLPILTDLHEHNFNGETAIAMTTAAVVSTASNYQCYLNLGVAYAAVSSSVSFYVPCIIMVAVYIKMYHLARYHAKRIEETQSHTVSNGSKTKPAENKALFTLGMIMGLFLLSWIPFFIVNLANSACKCVTPQLFASFTWLGYVNSTMNPIIYSKFNADFRAAFKKILLCERCRPRRDPYGIKPRNRTSSNVRLKRLTSSSIENGSIVMAKLSENGNSNNNQAEIKEFEEVSLLSKDYENGNRNDVHSIVISREIS